MPLACSALEQGGNALALAKETQRKSTGLSWRDSQMEVWLAANNLCHDQFDRVDRQL
jgi:hypothetical protein